MEDKLNSMMRENNQLKSELSRINLELEKQEGRFSRQVDEYEMEIDNITNKLKEKENTIKVSVIKKSLLRNLLNIIQVNLSARKTV